MAIVKEINIEVVSISDTCEQICLYWLNSKGGWSTWVFVKENNSTFEYERSKVYSRVVEDYAVTTNLYAARPHVSREVINVSAKSIEINQAHALSFIGSSARVYEVLKNEAGGFDFVEVEAGEPQISFNHDAAYADVFISFKRPERPF